MNPWIEPLTRRRRYTVAPRTWVPGELVTAGMMNSIRDNLNEVGTKVDTGAISVPGATGHDLIIAMSPTQLVPVKPVMGMVPRWDGDWKMVKPTAGPHDLWVPANAIHPSANMGYHTILTYGLGSFTTLPFPLGVWAQANFSCMLPRSWNLAGYNVQFAWLNWSSAGGVCHWMLYSAVIPNWTQINWTAGGAGSSAIGVPGAPYYLQITTPVFMPYSGAVSHNGVHNFLVQRAGPAGSDTFASTAYLVGVLITPVTDKDLDV